MPGVVACVDAVIVLTLFEAALLAAYRRRTGRGIAAREFALNMLSGLALMAALRSALTAGSTPVILLWLCGAGALHAADLLRRAR